MGTLSGNRPIQSMRQAGDQENRGIGRRTRIRSPLLTTHGREQHLARRALLAGGIVATRVWGLAETDQMPHGARVIIRIPFAHIILSACMQIGIGIAKQIRRTGCVSGRRGPVTLIIVTRILNREIHRARLIVLAIPAGVRWEERLTDRAIRTAFNFRLISATLVIAAKKQGGFHAR